MDITARAFFTALRDRPGMIMMNGEHPLHRLDAYIAGLRLQQSLPAHYEVAQALSLMKELPACIAGVDYEKGNSVGWFDLLMERNDFDEQRAFVEAINILISMAHDRGL